MSTYPGNGRLLADETTLEINEQPPAVSPLASKRATSLLGAALGLAGLAGSLLGFALGRRWTPPLEPAQLLSALLERLAAEKCPTSVRLADSSDWAGPLDYGFDGSFSVPNKHLGAAIQFRPDEIQTLSLSPSQQPPLHLTLGLMAVPPEEDGE